MDEFSTTGRPLGNETSTAANARFQSQYEQAVAQVRRGLIARILGTDRDKAELASDALKRFDDGLSKYSNRVREIVDGPKRHAGVGIIKSTGELILQWDPNYTNVERGVTSAPYVILAHELWHFIDRLTFSPSTVAAYERTPAGMFGNLFEARAMEFENLVRPENSPNRYFHDPSNTTNF